MVQQYWCVLYAAYSNRRWHTRYSCVCGLFTTLHPSIVESDNANPVLMKVARAPHTSFGVTMTPRMVYPYCAAEHKFSTNSKREWIKIDRNDTQA